ncbi:Putative methyltransferase type 11, S-adenosyl-L-methionine-dependent methyltransferase [Septoria linicola]|uniref:Methyltransferase type 11, S-adenosyl-L-methionine-dependent methyltransferase n=1 Tax=Septoria linicola TaxID=215465 RepID=A0A9Q9AFE6_9PEZI|nr:Putative methyltransferase type 11, S-adenosyl-L-methionine-dependent methyltransferase [Septoria linicola]
MTNTTILLPVAFTPSAPARKFDGTRNTVIEDAPQVSLRRAPPQRLQARVQIISPMSDDFPTPRAISACTTVEASPSLGSSDSESDQSSLWSKRTSESFDEMYDLTESEAEEVPIKLSTSVKRRVGKKDAKSRFPSIIIPSPGQWPTIEKLKSASALSPPLNINLSPSILAQLQERSLRVPSTSSAPSLDGSQTSEELGMSSCPSTPDLSKAAETWEPPVQLNPSSINLLQHINSEPQLEHSHVVLEIPVEAAAEMREVVDSPPITGHFRIDTQNLCPPTEEDADDELSALSVPSPGGFFASLDSTMARKTWAGVEATPTTSTATEFYGIPFHSARSSALPTSTATSFYNVPWSTRPENTVEHVVSVASPASVQDPVTARKVMFSPTDIISEVNEIDETYQSTLQQSASANIDRTQLWLSAQDAYMAAICEEDEVTTSFTDVEDANPKTPVQVSAVDVFDSPSKKSVRFVENKSTSSESAMVSVEQKRVSPIHDGTFWEAWRHNKRSQRARDVFQHRQARVEAEQARRVSLPKQHTDQLHGTFETVTAERPAPARPVSNLLPLAPEDERKELIATVDRERQALEQVQSSAWHLAAQRELNGGKLLTSPIVSSFKGRRDVRILDLAGQVHCSWAWDVAQDHPNASVYTTVSSDAEAHVLASSLEGPINHHVVTSPKLWELPFADDHFDVISARNLYTHLKTIWPKGCAADEWDLTLRECLRCLKPGGYLEFDLLDAELVHAEAVSQALGVEFAFNLKTRGYDPCAGKSFLPRLKRAGFCDIKRAWMVLPVADVVPRWSDSGKVSPAVAERSIAIDGTISQFEPPLTGSTIDVRAVTGLVGARMWEQWMLKLNIEMGRCEKRLTADVAKALQEGGKSNAGWRSLVGWARKEEC